MNLAAAQPLVAPPMGAVAEAGDWADLLDRYSVVRALSERLCEPLVTEDFIVQSMPDASPTRWHLAHTTWFFEHFVLKDSVTGYRVFHPGIERLFNSYYMAIGEPFPRAKRGLLSRPTVWEVFEYRRYVDSRMKTLLVDLRSAAADLLGRVELGLHHEQQHQELMLTDIKHAFWCNPLAPAYRPAPPKPLEAGRRPMLWLDFDEGLRWIGHPGDGFCFDNETPRHRVFVHAFSLADRLVTNREYANFMEDGGYRSPRLWLSDGWAAAQSEGWHAPLYWQEREDGWWQFTLGGLRPLVADEPVSHLSYYEADAFARWAGARLPTEAEWELAADVAEPGGNLLESESFHPRAAASAAPGLLQQMVGDLWEWTSSPYTPYPGYRPAEGALGEYNGKFMCNQYVLRGGSCVTPGSHIRPTYRNFFPPAARWQFSGIRLARDLAE